MRVPQVNPAEAVLMGLLVFAAAGAWPSHGEAWTAWRAVRLAAAAAMLLGIAYQAVRSGEPKPSPRRPWWKKTGDGLDEFRDLLDDATGRYVLIQAVPGSRSVETCAVYDIETRTGLIVDDDDLAEELKRRLVERGARILPNIPPAASD